MFNHPTLAVLWCCVCISTHLVPCAARRVVHVTHVRLKMMCCCMCAWWSSRTHTVCVTFPHHLIRSNTNVCFPWFIDTIAFTDSWSIFCVGKKGGLHRLSVSMQLFIISESEHSVSEVRKCLYTIDSLHTQTITSNKEAAQSHTQAAQSWITRVLLTQFHSSLDQYLHSMCGIL